MGIFCRQVAEFAPARQFFDSGEWQTGVALKDDLEQGLRTKSSYLGGFGAKHRQLALQQKRGGSGAEPVAESPYWQQADRFLVPLTMEK
jgi:hypothetical protein